MQEVIDIKPEPMPRSLDDITSEYKEICQTAGDIQYKVKAMEAHLYSLNEKLFSLNQEAEKQKVLNGKEKV